jgi:hypothetical protein
MLLSIDYVKDFGAAMKDSLVVTLLDDDKAGCEMAESTDAIKIGVSKETVLWLSNDDFYPPEVQVFYHTSTNTQARYWKMKMNR